MVDQVQNAMSSVEQYRMVQNIINLWATYRMTVMYVFGALLILTIVLYVMKSCWKKTFLFLTILAGLTILGFEGFVKYVEYKKQEALTSLVAAPVEAVADVVENTAGGLVKSVTGLVK